MVKQASEEPSLKVVDDGHHVLTMDRWTPSKDNIMLCNPLAERVSFLKRSTF